MLETRDLGEFARHNDNELRGIILSKCGALPNDVLDDHIQDIYLEFHRYRVLQKYNPELGTFERWVTTAVSWHLSRDKARNKRVAGTEHLNENMLFDDRDADNIRERIDGYVRYLKNRGAPRLHDLLLYLRAKIHGYTQNEMDLCWIKNLATIHRRYVDEYISAECGCTGPAC